MTKKNTSTSLTLHSRLYKSVSFLLGTRDEMREICSKVEEWQNVEISKEVWEKWIGFINGHIGYFSATIDYLARLFRKMRGSDEKEKLIFDKDASHRLFFCNAMLKAMREWRTSSSVRSVAKVKGKILPGFGSFTRNVEMMHIDVGPIFFCLGLTHNSFFYRPNTLKRVGIALRHSKNKAKKKLLSKNCVHFVIC